MSISPQESFFSTPESLESLQIFSRTLRSGSQELPSGRIAQALLKIIELIIANALKFDECCTSNIEWIGPNFMREVREFPELPTDKQPAAIASAFTSAFRFLCELEFTQPGDPSPEVRSIGKFVDGNLALFTEDDRQQLTFARYSMPVQVAKKLLNDPSIAEFRKFSKTVAEASKLKKDWETDLDERRLHVDAIRQSLKDVTSTYNFVGLVEGFRRLAATKSQEHKVAFWSLIALAMVMVTPPAFQIAYVLSNIDYLETKRGLLLYTLPTILAIEVILIYLFRVVLAQFRSVKAQVLQIDLRIALCQFVQSYAEYSMKVKKDDPTALAKFEALVFSSLLPDSESIPSTFDGAEQIANLIKSIRGG